LLPGAHDLDGLGQPLGAPAPQRRAAVAADPGAARSRADRPHNRPAHHAGDGRDALPGRRGRVMSDAATTRQRVVAWEDPVATARAGLALSGMDYLNAVIGGALPAPPISKLVGFT